MDSIQIIDSIRAQEQDFHHALADIRIPFDPSAKTRIDGIVEENIQAVMEGG